MEEDELRKRLDAWGPKRILSLDGGGVRGLITLGFLERLEEILRNRQPKGQQDDFRLCDYFDLIGGVSGGAIIASLLALGLKSAEIKRFYFELCPKIYHRPYFGFGAPRFSARRLHREMRRFLQKIARDAGEPRHEVTMDSELFRTGLAILCKRLDADGVRVISNVPGRRFWDPDNGPWADEDGDFFPGRWRRLWDVARASAAPPPPLPPLLVPVSYKAWRWKSELGAFIDAGTSPYNNPCRELFLTAALRPFPNTERSEDAPPNPTGLGWDTGASRLLMISIGAGQLHRRRPAWRFRRPAGDDPGGLRALRSVVRDGERDALAWMQAISEPAIPWRVDDRLGDMRNLRLVEKPLLTFQRYQVTMRRAALRELMGDSWARGNLSRPKFKELERQDNSRSVNLGRLDDIGVAAAAEAIEEEHLPPIFNLQ